MKNYRTSKTVDAPHEKQNCKTGMLARLSENPESRNEKVLRQVLTVGLVMILVGYVWLTKY